MTSDIHINKLLRYLGIAALSILSIIHLPQMIMATVLIGGVITVYHIYKQNLATE